MNYSDADYAKFPGLVRPRKIQTPRPKVSLRYPWKCNTLEDVRAELVKCPEGFRGALALEYQGRLINWEDAVELVTR